MKVDVIHSADADDVRSPEALVACKGISEAEEVPPDAKAILFTLPEVQEACRVLANNDSCLADRVKGWTSDWLRHLARRHAVTGCSLEELTESRKVD